MMAVGAVGGESYHAGVLDRMTGMPVMSPAAPIVCEIGFELVTPVAGFAESVSRFHFRIRDDWMLSVIQTL
jgi:hypothetical protein